MTDVFLAFANEIINISTIKRIYLDKERQGVVIERFQDSDLFFPEEEQFYKQTMDYIRCYLKVN